MTMKIVSIASAVVWVDFITILLSKIYPLGHSIDRWYSEFGMVAVLSDCLVIILGIMLAILLFPTYSLYGMILASILIQLVHDVLFFILVIRPVPIGHNKILDLFKQYSAENSWKILVADALMIGSSVYLASYLDKIPLLYSTFIGLLGVYSASYIIYTK